MIVTNILGTIDKKIETNKRKVEKLDNIARTLYDYWFIQYEFPNTEGKPFKSNGGRLSWNEALKREIPIGWRAEPLGSAFRITMGTSPQGDSINEIGNGIPFFQGATDFGVCVPHLRTYTDQPVRFAEYGDILLSVRAPVGAINIANMHCCIGRGLCSIHTEYRAFALYSLLALQPKFSQLNATGTTFGAITKNELHSILIAYPTNTIFEQFNTIVRPIEDEKLLAAKEIEQLTTLKSTLLPLLMNGQVKVQ